MRRGVTEGVAPEGSTRMTVEEWKRDERTGRRIQLAYRDRGEKEGLPVVLLLHGSPVASEALTPLMEAVGNRARLLVPDLPGFGGSTLKIADYSTRSHARSAFEMLDRLEISSVHAVGYSMGGGVALEMARLAPDRLDSLVLLSSIGVQELELLGNYTLNRAVHGLQLTVLTLIQESVPHFGVMDRFPVNRAYARNFYDTDQRPYREALQELRMPVLILHGVDDFLVPVAAAREHWRLVPQSEMSLWDPGDHLTVIREPERVARPLMDFVDRVEAGEVPGRSGASPERRALAAEPFEQHRSEPSLRFLLFMVGLLALATLVTEDLTCIGAGLLVAGGALGFWPAVAGCLAGIFVGDMLLYLAGRWLGRPALRRAPLRWMIKPGQVERGTAFFRRQGPALVFASRFMPGTRLATYFAAGVFRAPFASFAAWFFLATAVWTPLLVGLAAWMGGPLLAWFERFERFALLGLILAVFLLWVLVRLLVPMTNHRGRRTLLSAWRRKVRWEFWPMGLFYPPVVLYILWLGRKHRGMTVFTAANPAMPQGGFVRESKSAILRGLGESPEVARWRLLASDRPEAMMRELEGFLEEGGLDYPVVLKPDRGERGSGVEVIREPEAARRYFRTVTEEVIAQEYISGREFGVFYYRYPNEPEGRILSITDKRLITVRGDGRRRLEQLILDDDRAVCMAPFFLDRFGSRLAEVPTAGEEVALTDLGTHCRGALFLDGNHLRTEALENAVDRLSRRYEGFFFGRYDIRVPDEDSLREGDGLKVLELNGVTSESTNIYDPKNRLWSAYRTLFEQWRIAFAIGAQNRERGVSPATWSELWHLVRTKHSRR